MDLEVEVHPEEEAGALLVVSKKIVIYKECMIKRHGNQRSRVRG